MMGVLRTRIIIDEGLWHLKTEKLSLTSLKKYHACPQFHSDEELKRKKREERLEMIRHNAQLRYAMKRKGVHEQIWDFLNHLYQEINKVLWF